MQFQLFNIPVKIQPSFWVYLLMICFEMQTDPMKMILMATVFASSLLFHEFGHAIAAMSFGRKPEITLEALGGYATYAGPRLKDKQEFAVILTGPLFTALLIGVSYCLLHSHIFSSYWPYYFCYWMMKLNTYWLVINLAPLYPLDGGQMAAIFLRKWGLKGEKFAFLLGNMSAILGVVYFLWEQNYLFALLFAFYGWKNFQTMQAHPLGKQSSNPFAQLNEATRLLRQGEVGLAKKMFTKLHKAKDAYIRNLALEGLAQILAAEGKPKEAYKILLQGDVARMHEGKYLFWKLAYVEQDFGKMAVYARDIYEMYPTFNTALMNAKAYALMKDSSLALGWLHTARQFEEAKNGEGEKLLSESIFSSIENVQQRVYQTPSKGKTTR